MSNTSRVIQVCATTSRGSVERTVDLYHRGTAFMPFNSGFVRYFMKRPQVDISTIKEPLNRFFAEGAPRYSGPGLINREYFEAAMQELGLNPATVLVNKLPA